MNTDRKRPYKENAGVNHPFFKKKNMYDKMTVVTFENRILIEAKFILHLNRF